MSPSYGIFSVGYRVFALANVQICEGNRDCVESHSYCRLDVDIELFV